MKHKWSMDEGVLSAPDFPVPRGLVWGFTARDAGDISDPEARAALVGRYGAPGLRILKQVHGTRIVRSDDHEDKPEADGWLGVQGEKRLLAVKSADCLPVLFWSRDGRTFGSAHAGWRGAVAGIARAFVEKCGADPRSLTAVLGPAIGPCCYEVGTDVADRAGRDDRWLRERGNGHFLFDLPAYVSADLMEAGVPGENIVGCGMCTMCGGPFYSHRADGTEKRQIGFVGFPEGAP